MASKKRFNPPGVVPRTMEEIERVIRANPGTTIRDISQAIGRNRDFLYDLKLQPDKYLLSITDVQQLASIYGVDDIYIYKGLRYQEVKNEFEAAKAKIGAIRILLNSI